MVEYFIKDVKECLPTKFNKSNRGSSLINPSKKPYNKFVRQSIVDSTYNSQILEKVVFT